MPPTAPPANPAYQPAPAPSPSQARPGRADAAFVGTLTAIASVLAARLLLLLAVLGAFVLAVRADGQPGLTVLIAYGVLIVLPLVFMDVITRRRGGQ